MWLHSLMATLIIVTIILEPDSIGFSSFSYFDCILK